MNKILISSLTTIILLASQANAEASHTTKTAEELMQELAQLEQKIQQSNKETEALRKRQKDAIEKTEALDRLEKTVDELAKELGVDE